MSQKPLKELISDQALAKENDINSQKLRAEQIAESLNEFVGDAFKCEAEMKSDFVPAIVVLWKEHPLYRISVFTINKDSMLDSFEENFEYVKKALTRKKTGLDLFIAGCLNNWWGVSMLDEKGHFSLRNMNAYPLAINTPLDRY